MDISEGMLEQKRQELIGALAGTGSEGEDELIAQLKKLGALRDSYRALCAEFEARFVQSEPFIELEITEGALKQSYLNLRPAIRKGLVARGQEICISFPGVSLDSIRSDVRPDGNLRNRAAIKRFYKYANVRNTGRKVRFTRIGPNEYTLENVATGAGGSSLPRPAKRKLRFRFSMCGIVAGERVTFVDDPSVVCTVCDDTHVLYEGRRYFLTGLARALRNTTASLDGPCYFTYEGERLCDRRERFESGRRGRLPSASP